MKMQSFAHNAYRTILHFFHKQPVACSTATSEAPLNTEGYLTTLQLIDQSGYDHLDLALLKDGTCCTGLYLGPENWIGMYKFIGLDRKAHEISLSDLLRRFPESSGAIWLIIKRKKSLSPYLLIRHLKYSLVRKLMLFSLI